MSARRASALRGGDRARGAHAAAHRVEALQPGAGQLRPASESQRAPDLSRAARGAAGAERARGGARDPRRARDALQGASRARSSRARTTSIPICRRATRSPSTRIRSRPAAGSRSPAGRADAPAQRVRPHPHPHGRGRRQVDPRRGADRERRDARRPEPRRDPAARDRLRARPALARRGGGLPAHAAPDPALHRRLGCRHGEGSFPLRRKRLAAPRPARPRSGRAPSSRT